MLKALFSRLAGLLMPSPPEIEPGEDVVFVDVRTPGEYARGHVRGAVLIPHTEVGRRWKELEPHADRRILVYCRSGSRSAVATRILKDKGFERAENAGGIGGLRRAGVDIAE